MPKEISRAEIEEKIAELPKHLQEQAKALIPKEEPEKLKRAKKAGKVDKPISRESAQNMRDFIKETEGKSFRKLPPDPNRFD